MPNSIPSKTVSAVANELYDREKKGLLKYGVTLSNSNLSHEALLQHAKEEALDFANYLQQALTNASMERRNYEDLIGRLHHLIELLTQEKIVLGSDYVTADKLSQLLQEHISYRILSGDFRRE